MEFKKSKWWETLPQEKKAYLFDLYKEVALGVGNIDKDNVWHAYKESSKEADEPIPEESEGIVYKAFCNAYLTGIHKGLITAHMNFAEKMSAAPAQEVAN